MHLSVYTYQYTHISMCIPVEGVRKMRTIAVINQKGGVGKTSTALALGEGLSMRKRKVLLVDLDAQGNLTYTAGVGAAGYSAMDILQNPSLAGEAVQHAGRGDIIVSSPNLAGADTIIIQTGKEYRLREALETISGRYEYCVIDTPPALGILTINALTACDGAIIPAQADIYSVQGIAQLYNTIETVKRYCNPKLAIMGIVITRYNGRTIIRREVAEMLEETAENLHTKLYRSKIRECTALVEAQTMRESIYSYAPKSNAACDYTDLVNEILEEERQ